MSTRTQPTEVATLHFDLRHASDCTGFFINTGRGTHPLQEHTPESRVHHRTRNRALALMPDADLDKLTHYAEDVELPSDVARLTRVQFPIEDSPLPGLALVAIYVPRAARRSRRAPKLAALSPDAGFRHRTLADYGVPSIVGSEILETFLDADDINTPMEAAKAIVFHHPSLASRDPEVAATVMDDHIDTAPGLTEFATVISSQGPATKQGGWAKIAASVDPSGKPYQFDDKAGWTKQGDVYHYHLSDETTGAEGSVPLKSALRTAPQDLSLKNKKWSVNPGDAAKTEHVGTPDAATARDAATAGVRDTGGYTFTINNKTPGHGLDVSAKSLEYNPGTAAFSIGATNTYLRTLSAYVQFQDDQGTPVTPKNWDEVWGGIFDHDDAKKYFLTTASAVNNIMGIPMPFFTDPTSLAFTWPENASQADLMYGGMGTSHWDGDVATLGLIATGIFQYGVPILFLAAGAAIESSAWYKKFMEDKELVRAIYAVGAFLAAGLDAGYSTIVGIKQALSTLASTIAGLLVGPALEELAAWIFVKITAAEAEDSIPFAGWVARVANMVITAAEIAETTVEVLMAPATYTIQVKRLIEAQVTVHPDPTHGTTPQNAIWPTEADHWIATVQYKDGTNYVKTGPLPTADNADKPVVVLFDDLPSGNQLQVKFGVYSDTDWLAGQWTSSWLDALLPQGKTVLGIEGSIQENLVPLTPKTQYHYKQKVAWDGSSHVWHEGDQPTQTMADLNRSNDGNNLGDLVNIAINDKAYMLGYCWSASGQKVPLCGGKAYPGQMWTFANMSTLASPETGSKFSECGFDNQPYLIYDQFGPAPLFDLPKDVEGALDAAGTPNQAIQDAFTTANYSLTNETTHTTTAVITVKTPSAEWYIGEPGRAPLYDIRRVTDELQVFPYPQPAYSPNNFYVDPVAVTEEGGSSTIQYFLRQVKLDDTTPFGVNQPHAKSFGKFTVPHMDAFAVHPAGYVIAASWMFSKIQILKLADEPVPDEKAEPALFLSGQGVRQGLLYGPIALTITSDGRILVLETVNQRIQAFDINGNPVHCFDGAAVGGLSLAAATFASDLNGAVASDPLRKTFAAAGVGLSTTFTITDGRTAYGLSLVEGQFDVTENGSEMSTHWTIADTVSGVDYDVTLASNGTLPVSEKGKSLFSLAAADADPLNRGAVTSAIAAEFKTEGGITLPALAHCKVTGDGYQLPAATYEADLALGKISAALEAALRNDRGIELSDQATVGSTVAVTVKQKDKEWIVSDRVSDVSYKITPDAGDSSKLGVVLFNSSMALHVPDPKTKVTYLDLASEMKGYLYVLAYAGDGSKPDDYFMDIYKPSGEWLSRTPDPEIDASSTPVNASKLIVDQWRTMFTLNYEHYQGPNGTEPSISEWAPSTPSG